ncbi:MAG: DegT/DnrJ/EryC1/StrS family aminotransferase [Bacteriovoracaceae bacterium]|nr:DegT/DnrJ/EryC1/StrS family aminotransferase [Bacteriovoracaceae bacterium]
MIDYENLSKLNAPFFEDFKKSFSQTLDSGWYVLGKNVLSFEENFARFCGSGHCVGVASGLDALLLSLKALNLPSESEVLVPSNTYIATILAIMQLGLKPVLVEPRLETYNINPDEIRKKITSHSRVIMVVHLYGKACEMSEINKIAQEYNLKIIEDCAQAHGASINGQKVGTFGDFGAFSFYPTKNLGALGDAGAITTNDPSFAQAIRVLRNYGSEKKYYNEVIGYNSRLDEVQAGFLDIKLKSLDQINQHKINLAKTYHENLKEHVIKPIKQEGYQDVFHIYNIRHSRRDELKEYLLERGVKTEIHYPVAPHLQKAMRNAQLGESFPISEMIHQTTLSLPISFFHTTEEIFKVCEIINSFR